MEKNKLLAFWQENQGHVNFQVGLQNYVIPAVVYWPGKLMLTLIHRGMRIFTNLSFLKGIVGKMIPNSMHTKIN